MTNISYHTLKTNSKWIKDLDAGLEPQNTLDENKGHMLHDTGLSGVSEAQLQQQGKQKQKLTIGTYQTKKLLHKGRNYR